MNMNTTDNTMSTDGNNEASTLSTCANCGKEGSNLNSCNRCKLVKYCNAACKKKHRSKHKKKCDRRVAELHDETLFKQPPQNDECPICFLRMPSLHSGWKYNACCGKVLCCGCIIAGAKMEGNVDQLCPFCRTPAAETDEELLKRNKKRVEIHDADAIYNLGCWYAEGRRGFPQDWDKALGLWHRAGELGITLAYHSVGCAYFYGRGAERDEKKATHYFELAAMGGCVCARYQLGSSEGRAGNIERAFKHFMIAVGSGDNDSLKQIKQLYAIGYATKDDYAKALKAYQAYLSEVKSDDRDKAAAFSDAYKYY